MSKEKDSSYPASSLSLLTSCNVKIGLPLLPAEEIRPALKGAKGNAEWSTGWLSTFTCLFKGERDRFWSCTPKLSGYWHWGKVNIEECCFYGKGGIPEPKKCGYPIRVLIFKLRSLSANSELK